MERWTGYDPSQYIALQAIARLKNRDEMGLIDDLKERGIEAVAYMGRLPGGLLFNRKEISQALFSSTKKEEKNQTNLTSYQKSIYLSAQDASEEFGEDVGRWRSLLKDCKIQARYVRNRGGHPISLYARADVEKLAEKYRDSDLLTLDEIVSLLPQGCGKEHAEMLLKVFRIHCVRKKPARYRKSQIEAAILLFNPS